MSPGTRTRLLLLIVLCASSRATAPSRISRSPTSSATRAPCPPRSSTRSPPALRLTSSGRPGPTHTRAPSSPTSPPLPPSTPSFPYPSRSNADLRLDQHHEVGSQHRCGVVQDRRGGVDRCKRLGGHGRAHQQAELHLARDDPGEPQGGPVPPPPRDHCPALCGHVPRRTA